MWEIKSTPEYNEWFKGLDSDSKINIRAKVLLLKEKGPNLPRPYADTLKGTKIPNLKELRIKTSSHLYRISFIFDSERNGILLTAGDKKGKNEKVFYKKLIDDSMAILNKYHILDGGKK